MARKTAIRISNAELAAEDAAKLRRIDAAHRETRPSTADIIRQMRGDRLADSDRSAALLKRCQDAARLELRGDQFSADDRLDVASDLMARVLTDYRPNVPMVSDDAVSLTVLCGRARNLRRSIEAVRERDHAAFLSTAAERAASAESESATIAAEDAAVRAANRADDAKREAARLCGALGVQTGGPCEAVLYQWLRDASGARCAEELGYTAGSWRVRVSAGGKLLRAMHTDAVPMLAAILPDDAGVIDARVTAEDGTVSGEIIFAVRDDSREAHSATRAMADPASGIKHWREGTDAGKRAERPETAADARAACDIRHSRRDPAKLAAEAQTRRDAARDGRRTRKLTGRSVRLVRESGRSDLQARADALRNIGRAYASESHRERAAASESSVKRARDAKRDA